MTIQSLRSSIVLLSTSVGSEHRTLYNLHLHLTGTFSPAILAELKSKPLVFGDQAAKFGLQEAEGIPQCEKSKLQCPQSKHKELSGHGLLLSAARLPL